MRIFPLNPFFKFLITGGVNTVFGYIVYSTYVFLTGSETWSVILATITSTLFNFKTYGTFVFNSKGNSRLIRFFAAYAVLAILQIFLLKAINALGLTNPYLAGGVVMVPMAVIYFVTLKKFVFQQPLFASPKKESENESS